MENETCYYQCTPKIKTDGFWYVGDEFTNVRAVGKNGEIPQRGADGYWYISGKNMNVKAIGDQGAKGDKGDKGILGDQGPNGDRGPVGQQGTRGPTGGQGITGDPGPLGRIGPKGDPGMNGTQGPEGPRGPRGDAGTVGLQGIRGLQGVKGDIGDEGAQGIPGPVYLANNLTTDAEGVGLDARQGKVLNGGTAELKNMLSSLRNWETACTKLEPIYTRDIEICFNREFQLLSINTNAIRATGTLLPGDVLARIPANKMPLFTEDKLIRGAFWDYSGTGAGECVIYITLQLDAPVGDSCALKVVSYCVAGTKAYTPNAILGEAVISTAHWA